MKVTNVFVENGECVGYVIHADSFGEVDPRRANYAWPQETAGGYRILCDLNWGIGDIIPV